MGLKSFATAHLPKYKDFDGKTPSPRGSALSYNHLSAKGLKVFSEAEFCVESENPFLVKGNHQD